jgi:prepilin-type processing-associated H-X9-DG protein
MPVYAMNMKELEEYGQTPWGIKGQEDKEPLKRSVLPTWREDTEEGKDMPVNLAKLAAMKDTDQLDSDGEKAPKPDLSETAPRPVHGDHRNVLFYDFHAGRVDIVMDTSGNPTKQTKE